ncbi:MAG: ABC transporter permease subunit [Conexivisphaerales archaeon]
MDVIYTISTYNAVTKMKPITKWAGILTLPAIIYFLVFTVYPIIGNVILSFQRETLTGALVWTGWFNYHTILVDPYFGLVFKNTIFYMITVPFIDIALAIPLAALLKRTNSRIMLLLVLLPSFIPFVTAAVSWELVLNPFYGPVYYFARFNWFKTIWMIVIMDVWESLPMAALFIFAGLKSIPNEIEEASKVDGLRGIRKLMQVDLPYILPNILMSLVLSIIFATFTFDPIFVTQGEVPPMSNVDLAYYSYQQFFTGIIGYAAVLIIIMSVMSTIMSYAFVRVLRGNPANKPAKSNTSRWQSFASRFPNLPMPSIATWLASAIYLIFFMFPLVWVFLESLKPGAQIFSIPPIILTSTPSLVHYASAIFKGLPFLLSSLIVAVGVLLITVFVGTPAAFAMSRYNIGGDKLLIYVLFIYTLPSIIFMLPLYEIMNALGLINTMWALIFTYPVFVLPVVIWLSYNFYKNFPAHIDEAAQVDGMNLVKAYFKVIMPMSMDGIMIAVLYSFMISWGALIFPLVLTYSPFSMNLAAPYGAQTYSIFIGSTLGHESVNYGTLAAASIISLIPPVILLYVMRDRLERMYRVGGTKG